MKFRKHAKSEIEKMFAEEKLMCNGLTMLLKYFGGDAGTESTDFFGLMQKFISLFYNTLDQVNKVELMKVSKTAIRKETAEDVKCNTVLCVWFKNNFGLT